MQQLNRDDHARLEERRLPDNLAGQSGMAILD